MSDYFLGQIIATSFGFVPRDFEACNGQLLRILGNERLFAILGLKYGGDGMSTFGLPDLRGRTPIGAGVSADSSWQPSDVNPGGLGGSEKVILAAENLPPHNHSLKATESKVTPVRNPAAGVLGAGGANNLYRASSTNTVKLASGSVAPGAAASGHENMQPFVVLNYCICVKGIFPSRS